MTEKNLGGRPLKYDLDVIETAIDDYMRYCKDNEEIPDIEGYSIFLGTTRKTLLDYEHKEAFSYAIKIAKERIFHAKKQLALKGKMNPIVFIFDAKNNHEYKDKQEIDVNAKMVIFDGDDGLTD